MQIAVYTVAQDDEGDVSDWAAVTSGADYRLVVDAGSSDATVAKLRAAGIETYRVDVRPWRSDDAFNAALTLMHPDTDICIRLDMNERLRPNWRPALERAWTERTTMLRYAFNWGWISYIGDRIHRRGSYRWRGQGHERLVWTGDEDRARFAHHCSRIVIDHQPRNKSRPYMLPLLEGDAKEWPHDPDIALVYARELVYQERYDDGQREIQRFLMLAGGTGARAAYAFRLLAIIDRERALYYFAKAEAAHSCPSNYMAMADYYYHTRQWRLCYTSIQYCFTLERARALELPPDWGDDPRLGTALPHSLASVAAFYLWDFEAAYGHAVEAVRRAPHDQQLRVHLARVEAKITAGATVRRIAPAVPQKLTFQPMEEAADS